MGTLIRPDCCLSAALRENNNSFPVFAHSDTWRRKVLPGLGWSPAPTGRGAPLRNGEWHAGYLDAALPLGFRLVHDISGLHPSSLWVVKSQEGSHLWATCMKSPLIASFNAGVSLVCITYVTVVTIHFFLPFPVSFSSLSAICRYDGCTDYQLQL